MTAQPQPRRLVRAARSRVTSATPDFNWAWFVLALLFVGFWLFASHMERVDGNVVLATLFRRDPAQVALTPFPVWLTWPVEMFHWRVLRHFIPVIVGWWFAVQAAISMIQVLYQTPDRQTAADFLRRQRRNRALVQEEPVSADNLAELQSQSISLRVGGPALITIPDGYAGVTERNARFLRVLPPGTRILGRFEYLFNVVELRPRERSAKDVTVLTREGIPLKTDLELAFRIDPGNEPATSRRPFPYSEEAVKKAAYTGSVGADGQVSTWLDVPIGKVRGVLSRLVSDEPLNNWIAPDADRHDHQFLTNVVTQKLGESLSGEGIKPLRLRISRLTPPQEVSHQYTEYWLATQQKEDLLARANGTAGLIQEHETAQFAADIAMLQAVAEGIQLAQQETGVQLSSFQLTFHLLKALRAMFKHSAENLQSVGGDTDQLVADIDAITGSLMELEERLQLPRPNFNPSTPD